MQAFSDLAVLARRKAAFDQNNDWFGSAETYLAELKTEVDELAEAINLGRHCHTEDELGDVFWDLLNLAVALEAESSVRLDSLLERAYRKYRERIGGIEVGRRWADIKQEQKRRLAEEQAAFDSGGS